MYTSRFFYLSLLFAGGFLLYLLSPILSPFLLSFLLAYLGTPAIDRLQARGFSRTTGVLLLFLGFSLCIFFIFFVLVPRLALQLHHLTEHLPEYLLWLKNKIAPALQKLFEIEKLNRETLGNILREHFSLASGIASAFLRSFGHSVGALISLASFLFLTPVLSFYLLRDWNLCLRKIDELIPLPYKPSCHSLFQQCDAVLSGFLRGQFCVMMALGAIYSLGLSLIGLDLAIAIGFFAGLVSFVPYLGLIVGFVLAGGMALLQFQDFWHVLAVGGVFLVAQALEATVLTPKLVGDRTGLHPVAVLFFLMAGGQLFGFMGILLAIPLGAVINVLLSFVKKRYLLAEAHSFLLPEEQYIYHEKKYEKIA